METAILSNGRHHLYATRIPGGFRFRLEGAPVPAQAEVTIRGVKIPASEALPAFSEYQEAVAEEIEDGDAPNFSNPHPFTHEEITANLKEVAE
jgi:hypothetical protein